MQEGPWTPQNKPATDTRVIINPDVSSKYPGVWKVINRLQVNVVLQRENGVGKNLRIRPEYLLPAPTQTPINPLTSTAIGGLTEYSAAEAIVQDVPVYAPLEIGTVVRVAGPSVPKAKLSPDTLMVVLADNTYKNNSVKLVELGGNKGRYWPKIPRGYITVVKLVDILK